MIKHTKKFTRHLSHYLPLFGILVAGLLGFLLFSYDRAFQLTISIAMTASYLAWGLIHHYLHDDLNLFVIIEYVVIATFCCPHKNKSPLIGYAMSTSGVGQVAGFSLKLNFK